MKKHLRSLREYIDTLKAIGELQEIDLEVDWNLEIGAISRRCYETGAPAPLFNTITGIELGFRVLGAPAGVSCQPTLYLSRIAISLGLTPTASGQEIVEALVEARNRNLSLPSLSIALPAKRISCSATKWIYGDFPPRCCTREMAGVTSIPTVSSSPKRQISNGQTGQSLALCCWMKIG